jgi:16S rRNA (cytosine967-C5)-methyltransferase
VKSKLPASRAAISPARSAAFDILFRVEREGSYASELLHSRAYVALTETNHSLTTELVMGVLRWRSLLDSEISRNSSQAIAKLDLEVLIALRLAVYQVRWLDRIPVHAAINESVNLVKKARKRSAAPFVNGVMRKIASGLSSSRQEPHSINGESADTLGVSSAHPQWLIERWVHEYGLNAAAHICEYNQSRPTTAIRLRQPEAEDRLKAEGIELAAGCILAAARRVIHGDVTRTSALRAGLCVIQDEASQLVAALVGDGSRILDCCAAPGGKTLAIADHNPTADIFGIELHPHRARLLQKLLRSSNGAIDAGGPNIRVLAADARELPFSAKFDRVLADVPCSGTGTLSRNPEIKWRLAAKDFADLQTRQLAILRSAMDRVAIGGSLIYSTCSLEREENEDVIERALAQDSSFRLVDCRIELERLRKEGELIWENLSSLTRGPYLCTLPGVHPCDGFFAALLKRI